VTGTFDLKPVDPTPPVATPTASKHCANILIKSETPDNTSGWIMQLKDGVLNIGSQVPRPPYQQRVTLDQGAHEITAHWTKPTAPTPLISPELVVTCP
jgi:hypothetical protein